MPIIQISKVLERRGPELELPGAPTNLNPLVFAPGLDSGQIAVATDTGRVFVGHNPTIGQVNYKRASFPYQNIEILTEASIDKLRTIFDFLNRDLGTGSFHSALLTPGDDWQDVEAARSSGMAFPYTFPGVDLVASIDYYCVREFNDAGTLRHDPQRQGTLRVLSHSEEVEAEVIDEGVTARRLDLARPFSVEGGPVTETVIFRVLRDDSDGTDRFRFQYLSFLDEPARLYFRVQRPTYSASQIYDSYGLAPSAGDTSGSSFGYSLQEIQDIVGAMVTDDVQNGISVGYDKASGKLNFSTGPKFTALDIQKIVGAMVSGNSETGINVIYNANAAKLDFAVPPPAPPPSIEDIQAIVGGMVTGDAQNGIQVVYNANTAKIDFMVPPPPAPPSTQDIQAIVGAMVSNNIEDNIQVVYDANVGKLNFLAPRAYSQSDIQMIVAGMVNGDIQNGIVVTYDANSAKLNFTVPSLTTQNIQDIVGGMVQGDVQANIAVTYDSNAAKINFAVPNAYSSDDIKRIVGEMVVGDLQSGINVTFNPNAATLDFVVPPPKEVSAQDIQAIVGAMVQNDAQTGISVTFNANTSKLDFAVPTPPTPPSVQDIQAIVGQMVQNDAQTGISVTFNANTSKLDFAVPQPPVPPSAQDIRAIVGQMVQNDAQTGITVTFNANTSKLDFAVPTPPAPPSDQYIRTLVGQMVQNDAQTGISVTFNANTSKLDFAVPTPPTPPSAQDIRAIVGGMVQGDVQSGITVNYNANTSKLDFIVPPPATVSAYDIQQVVGAMMTGDVQTGISVTYNANTSKIDFAVPPPPTPPSDQYIRNLVGNMVTGDVQNGITVAYNTNTSKIDFAVPASLAQADVQRIVGQMVTGDVQNGITVAYNANTSKLDFNVPTQTANIQAVVGAMVQGDNQSNISVTYNTATSKLDFSVPRYSQRDISDIVGSMVSGNNESGITVAYNTSTAKLDFSVPTPPSAQDIRSTVGAMVSGNVETGISVTYNTSTQALDFNVPGPSYSFSGDVSGSVSGLSANGTLTLATTGVTAGTYTTPRVTVDAKGRITAISSGAAASGGSLTTTDSKNTVSNATILQVAGIANAVTGGANTNGGNTVIITVPQATGTFFANAANQYFSTYPGNLSNYVIWNTIGTTQVQTVSGFQRTITVNANISANSSVQAAKYLRLSVNGNVVASSIQPWGTMNSGGNLQITWQDNLSTRTNALPIRAEVAIQVLDGNTSTQTYAVTSHAINVMQFPGTGGTTQNSVFGFPYWRIRIYNSVGGVQNGVTYLPGVSNFKMLDWGGNNLIAYGANSYGNGSPIASPAGSNYSITGGFQPPTSTSQGWQATSRGTDGSVWFGYQFGYPVQVAVIQWNGTYNSTRLNSPGQWNVETSYDGTNWIIWNGGSDTTGVTATQTYSANQPSVSNNGQL